MPILKQGGLWLPFFWGKQIMVLHRDDVSAGIAETLRESLSTALAAVVVVRALEARQASCHDTLHRIKASNF